MDFSRYLSSLAIFLSVSLLIMTTTSVILRRRALSKTNAPAAER